MIPSAASTETDSKPLLRGKAGSVFIEASMILPVTCLILTALIGIIMTFHGNLAKQTKLYGEEVKSWDRSVQVEIVRNYERFTDWIR